MKAQNNVTVQDQDGNSTKPLLVAGLIVSGGNFKLKKKIETLDEFWEVINTEKSFFARHRMYPTAFFFSWQIKSINQWLSGGWFWVTETCH